MLHHRRPAPQQPLPSQVNGVPLLAQFQRQTPDAYAVRDLHYGDIVTIPKDRALPEPFPPTPELPVPGVRVLRWSGVALLLAVLGGVGGLLLGLFCLLAALAGIVRFRRRAHRWRAAHVNAPLPAPARAEYDRLRGARGQALLAIVIGLGIVTLIANTVR